MTHPPSAPEGGPSKELPRGVSVIPYRNGHFAVSQRLNVEKHKGLFQFPGGHVEPGELTVRAAQRELIEETGLNLPIQRFIFLGKTGPLIGYKGEEYVGWRYAVVLTPEEELRCTEPDKSTEWVWYPADAMLGLKMLQQTQNYAFAFHAGFRSRPAPLSEPSELEEVAKGLVDALKQIEEGAGPFNRDPLTHASNTIDAMKQLARAALQRFAALKGKS